MRRQSAWISAAIAIATFFGPGASGASAQNQVGGHIGVVLPLVTRANGTTTSISDDFVIGFPMGITVRDLIEYLDCDRQFHAEMVSIIGNPRLTDLVDRLRRQARLFGLQQLADTGRLLASAQEHRAMIRMLQTGDVAASESLMSAHIGHTRGLWAGRSD